jgi:hypothetical protein
MTFLVETFPCLQHLAKLIPSPDQLHPVVQSEVVPMKILFRDEKYKAETIEILSQLLKDAGLSGDQKVTITVTKIVNVSIVRTTLNTSLVSRPYFMGMRLPKYTNAVYIQIQQIVVGDQLTCKNIRGCKLWRMTENHPKDRLSWSCETPGVHNTQ